MFVQGLTFAIGASNVHILFLSKHTVTVHGFNPFLNKQQFNPTIWKT